MPPARLAASPARRGVVAFDYHCRIGRAHGTGTIPGIGECLEKGDDGLAIFAGEGESAFGVFGDVGVRSEGCTPSSVVIDDFFERGEAAVVHVGAGEFNALLRSEGILKRPASAGRPVTLFG